MIFRNIISIAFSICLCFSCQTKSKDKKEPAEEPVVKKESSIAFDFEHPARRWALSDSLLEVSGIAWTGENKIMAIEDFRPLLYNLNLGDSLATITEKIPFKETSKEKYDIEDLALIKDTVFALYSHGKLFKIWNEKKKLMVDEIKLDLDKANNTEGLAYDPVTGNLLIACKNESAMDDEKKSTRSVFEFDTKNNMLKPEPFLLIHEKEFKEVAGEKIEFYPSAIAVHPATYDIYVMSTKETKCLAQFTHEGQLKAFSYLDKEMLPQPEGICFDSNGNLYISTEGRHGKPAYIYKFLPKNQ